MPTRVIIDTDPGIDDAMAIFCALSSPELDVVGLTTVFGNAHTPVCTRNALRLLEIAGRTDIPVAEGAHRPMAMNFRGPADFVHGADGQGDIDDIAPATSAIEADAVQFIVDTVMASPGQITLVPIGPLTNIAQALSYDPRLAENLAGIVLMGGNAFCGGNASPAAEANIINDPEAADIVFGARCPVVMAGLDVTERTHMSGEQLDRIAHVDNPLAHHVARILPYYRAFSMSESGDDGVCCHDSTAISYLIAPQHYTSVSHPIRVDCGEGIGRGKTWPTTRPLRGVSAWDGRPDVTILTDVDANAVVDLLLNRLGVQP